MLNKIEYENIPLTGNPDDIPTVNDNKSHTPVDDIIEWSKKNMKTAIVPTDYLEDLEKQWIEFNSMPLDHRRQSDWKSIELFGLTNMDRYNQIKSDILNRDIDNEIEGDFDFGSDDNTEYMNESSDVSLDFTDYYYDTDGVSYTTADVEKAVKWAEESSRIIITPTRTLDELESLWDSFNSMLNRHRRESDWMSLECFGITNLRHYDYLKSQFLKDDINNKTELDIIGMTENASIIGDSASISKKYFEEACKTETPNSIAKRLLMMKIRNNTFYENMITDNAISDVMDTYDGITYNSPFTDIPFGDLPLIAPQDMIDSGVFASNPELNYYSAIADNSMLDETMPVSEWFEMYRANFDGFYTEFGSYMGKWVNKVRELTFGLNAIKESGDEKAIAARKQSILELGWNPEVPFDKKNRIMAKNITMTKMSEASVPTRFIDIRGYYSNRNISVLESIENKDKLNPIYIVLTEGKNIFSNAIKNITKDIYSHASISFDSTLRKMYSFGIHGSSNGKRGGFVEEDVTRSPEKSKIAVFVLFVKDKEYNIIKNMVESMKNNIAKTAYSYKNLMTFLFNTPYQTDMKMICSQFVDRCLKLCGIDITRKDSSLVSPHDLKVSAKKNKSIYSVYEGLANQYNSDKIKSVISGISIKANPIKENSKHYTKDEYIYEVINSIGDIDKLNSLRPHMESVLSKESNEYKLIENMVFAGITAVPYTEAKEFPVQFDADGNMILNNLKFINYDAEYNKSHKLLKEYFKSNNAEGIKYELSKLWMILNIIENKIHSKNSKDKSKEYNAKARITNDFKYYMSKLLEMEPEFNFTEYYNNSPFSDASIKINNTTLQYMGKLLGKFVKYL